MYHLPGNVISATADLVYIDLPEYELSTQLVSDNFRSLEKNGVGAPSSPATPRETVLHGVRLLVRGYLRVKFDILSSIKFRDISGFPNWEPITLIRVTP